MTITNGYATLAQFKQRTGITSTDANRDTDLELIIQASSRKIDQYCGRVFYATAAGVVRYFTAQNVHRCYVNDYTALTAVETDDDGDGTIETTWAATDYRKMPIQDAGGLWPYTFLEVMPQGNYTFPKGLTGGVKLTGTWGWTAVPDEVREACLLTSNRLWQRRAAAFGVLGSNEFGAPTVITKLDPDIQSLLEPFRRIAP